MKSRYLVLFGALAMLFLFAACDIDDLQAMSKVTEDFSETHTLADGGTLEVFTKNGSVEVLGWEKNTVEIKGTKYARNHDELKSIRIDIAASENSIVVKSVFPDSRARNKGVRYVIRAPYKSLVTTLDTSNGHIRVEDVARASKLDTSNGSITVRRTAGPVVADTSNGSIQVRETRGDLRMDTSNGRIEAEDVAGAVIADTSNGSIRVSMAEPTPGATLRFDTSNGAVEVTMKRFAGNPMILDSSNGSITLRLPDGINANLHAETSNGGIQTDFPVTVNGELRKHSLTTRLGEGGPAISLSTSNSSVRILRY